MKETVLRDFFILAASAENLAIDLKGAFLRRGIEIVHPIEGMSQHFVVKSSHLIRLCDAVLDGDLDSQVLEAVGFCLIASDYFQWDGDDADGSRVAEVVGDWSSPEINCPLNWENVEKWRSFLRTGASPFSKQAGCGPPRECS